MSESSGSGPPAETVSSRTNTLPSETKVDQKTLTLVLPASKAGKEDRYAVVTFPETYEDAVAAAIKSLGHYMDNPGSAINLRCSVKNRNGAWVWADIIPEQWHTILERNPMEVGIFEQPSAATFRHGSMHFVYCCPPNKLDIQWSPLTTNNVANTNQSLSSPPFEMDRPENFSNAVEQVQAKLQAVAAGHVTTTLTAKARAAVNCDIFEFCTFTHSDLRIWVAFPSAAYTDEKVWQAVVPPPGGILGVMISKSND